MQKTTCSRLLTTDCDLGWCRVGGHGPSFKLRMGGGMSMVGGTATVPEPCARAVDSSVLILVNVKMPCQDAMSSVVLRGSSHGWIFFSLSVRSAFSKSPKLANS